MHFKSRVMILDEPTNHLSAKVIGFVCGLKAQGVTSIFISHNMHSVFACCDGVVAMDPGRVVQDKPVCQTSIDEVHGVLQAMPRSLAGKHGRLPGGHGTIGQAMAQVFAAAGAAVTALERARRRHAPLRTGMKARGWGRVVNLTSPTPNGQWDGYVPCVASRGALLGLTRGLAREPGGHGIAVNTIAPGAVIAEAENRVFVDRLAAYHAWVLERQSLKVRIEAGDVVNLAACLASNAARMMSGQNTAIEGGW